MIQTTLAYVGDYLGKFFFYDKYGNDYKNRVVYGDNDSYFKQLNNNKLQLPGLVYTLTQLTLPHGPSKPTSFSGNDNAGGTKRLEYNAKRARITCSMALYCANSIESFELIQRYLELQNNSVVLVKYWATDLDAIEIECALNSFEDASIPPAGRKSEDFDSTGLLYEIEAGFSVDTLFLETKQKHIIRCVKYEKWLQPISDSLVCELISSEEYTDTDEYLQSLKDRKEK